MRSFVISSINKFYGYQSTPESSTRAHKTSPVSPHLNILRSGERSSNVDRRCWRSMSCQNKTTSDSMNINPTESEVQMQLVDYLTLLENQGKVLWFTGSGNGQFQKSIMVKMKMHREWIRPGMPDLMICFRKHIVFIELKREKTGRLTEWQQKAIKAINTVWDQSDVVAAFVCYGFKEAEAIINNYI